MSGGPPEWLTSQLELPVINAPMFLVSSPEMVVASCEAGIIGSFPLANARTREDLDEMLQYITEERTKAENADSVRKIAPWAVNLIVHRTNNRYQEFLGFIEKYQPPIVITSLGDPSEVIEIVHRYGGLVFSDVINLVHAKKAVEKGTDGLILVCNGAGGHAGTFNPFAFISAVKEFWDGITILAGGISTGKDIVAANILGADLVYMGTRFLATEESLTNKEYQQILVESTIEDIIYTDTFSGIHANYLLPSLKRVGIDPEKVLKKESFDWSRENEGVRLKAWKDIWSAGHGVGTIKKVQSISEVVGELKAEYDKTNSGLK
ncbi:nitronate monooxygenase [Bacillus sp. B15-48]|uniref:NAD(P)H-dependent flavin oxidoreductase n=1 Tax=Bacillus sp. B15-48 TaxID=1548601 RepID=UPI00194014E0|nr:nitronate monooxygenase [Bacillus sp. B15-48]MBM4765164.1 nitronate monooxygenase [Bacillus sp. B15-48]